MEPSLESCGGRNTNIQPLGVYLAVVRPPGIPSGVKCGTCAARRSVRDLVYAIRSLSYVRYEPYDDPQLTVAQEPSIGTGGSYTLLCSTVAPAPAHRRVVTVNKLKKLISKREAAAAPDGGGRRAAYTPPGVYPQRSTRRAVSTACTGAKPNVGIPTRNSATGAALS